MSRLGFVVVVVVPVWALACGSACTVQCPRISVEAITDGCEASASGCSDGAEYSVRCVGAEDIGYSCRCFENDVSPFGSEFFTGDICELQNSDSVVDRMNRGCDFALSDPT